LHHRCSWATTDELVHYHDHEWGVPSHDDAHLFEMLTLEGAQAGLSWAIILRKRNGYRHAFAGFDVDRIARFTPEKIDALMQDARIVRNRAKLESVVINARAVQRIRAEHGSLAQFVWSFVDGAPVQNDWASSRDAPTHTRASAALSRALKHYGCKFVGATICYAFMQAVGMVNDHEHDCPRRACCAAAMDPSKASGAASGCAGACAGA